MSQYIVTIDTSGGLTPAQSGDPANVPTGLLRDQSTKTHTMVPVTALNEADALTKPRPAGKIISVLVVPGT